MTQKIVNNFGLFKDTSLIVIILYRPREESFLISKIYNIERNSSEKKYTMRREDWRNQNIWGKNKFNCIDIAGKDWILFFITTLRTNSFQWKDLKKALHLISVECESKHTLSRFAAQRICETKILYVNLKIRRVRDTLKCELGKKEVWTPNMVLISEFRESRVTYGSERLREVWIKDLSSQVMLIPDEKATINWKRNERKVIKKAHKNKR